MHTPHQQLLRLLTVCFMLLLASSAVRAQQSSVELRELQQTTKDLYQSGAYAEAQQVAERALAVVLRDYGPEHEQTSIQYHSLGLISEAAGDLAAASRYYTAGLRIKEKVYGPESPAVAVALENLGGVFVKSGQLDAAEPLLQHALKIRQDLVGRDHAFAASGHANLATLNLARGNWQAALTSYREAVRLLTSQDTSQTIVKSLVEDDIKRHRDTFVGLCRAAWNLQAAPATKPTAAVDETFQTAQLAWKTSAAGAIAKMTARLGTENSELGQRVRRAQDLADKVLSLHADDQKLLSEWSAVQRTDKAYSALADEFRRLSIARNRDNAPTIRRQTLLVEQLRTLMQRCSSAKTSGCVDSNRERDVISKELAELSRATAAGVTDVMDLHRRMEAAEQALPGYQAFTSRRTALRTAIDGAENDVSQARALIVKSFPDYVALSDPKPLTVAAAQALLRHDEALVAILTGTTKSFVWALTHERAEWAEIDAGSAALSAHVTALRRGLDPLAQQNAEGTKEGRVGVVEGFDLQRAHELYTLVLEPVAGTFAGKHHLILVPTGPLTSLPFQVLLTQPPAISGAAAEVFARAPWLIKSYGLSVLPSIQALSALRRLSRGNQAAQPFFGMGDPILLGPSPDQQQRSASRSAATPKRFYRNGLADIRTVRELMPLPDTANELRTIAKTLGAPPNAVYIREAATETRVKTAALTEYRILQFATHGLVAGDLSGLTEPALVLTPPDVPTEADDGLLTASEIASLKINADWVVLSACNTAAGDGEGAEALSGLARAFFYAGARALLVSHWPVYSQAATELTTKTFAALAAAPDIGRAQAFRRSMLTLIAEGRPPGYWAPFIVVGEAGSAEH